jgi:DNA-binding protein H-NS
MSKKMNLDAMSIDEMWQLHEEISRILSVRLTSLNEAPRERRKYPRVLPKYRNPEEHSETWSGRGKQPRWLVAALEDGHKIEEFVIRGANEKKGHARRARA